MNWLQATFVVDAAQVDVLSTMLDAFFAQAVTTENAGEEEFYEVAFPGVPDWKKVRVTALFGEEVDLDPIIQFVHKQLSNENSDEIPVSVSKLVDQDWQRVWLASFKPINIGNNLWVCPSWCDPVDAEARNIILDPGLAFGTGTHATTSMCLKWLSEQNLSDQTVLDYGSGSGILAIGAIYAGATYADAVDIDQLAVDACDMNAERNHVTNKMTSCLPQDLSADKKYDLVIANILADVIIELHDTLLLHLAPGGTLLLTGILQNQAEKVTQAFSDDLEFDMLTQEQWCLLMSRNV